MRQTPGHIDKGERSGRLLIRGIAPDLRTHNLHLYSTDDPLLVRQLVFRDRLRANEILRRAYTDLKAGLLGGARRDFAPGKTTFIERVVSGQST